MTDRRFKIRFLVPVTIEVEADNPNRALQRAWNVLQDVSTNVWRGPYVRGATALAMHNDATVSECVQSFPLAETASCAAENVDANGCEVAP